MARLTIDLGTAGNSATGDSVRGAFNKVNRNFEELYGKHSLEDNGLVTPTTTNSNLVLQPNGSGFVEVDKLKIQDDSITSIETNGSVDITGNGTGSVNIEGLNIIGTEISATDSTAVTVRDNLIVTGQILGNVNITSIDADSTTVSNLTITNFKSDTVVLESEGIASNDNDTSIPTSAAVKDFADNKFISLATLKTEVAASADFAEFKTRIAAL